MMTGTLEDLIESGVLRSTQTEWLALTYLSGNPKTWYARVIEESGQEAADEELANWLDSSHSVLFGSCVELIARAVARLGERNEDYVKDVTHVVMPIRIPSLPTTTLSRRMFFVPDLSYVGVQGELTPVSMFLEAGYNCGGEVVAGITLIFPMWGDGAPENHFVAVTLGTTGECRATKYVLEEVEAATPLTLSAFLEQINERTQVGGYSMSLHLDQGALDKLARLLPSLHMNLTAQAC